MVVVYLTYRLPVKNGGLKEEGLKILDDALKVGKIELNDLLREVTDDLDNPEVSISEKQMLRKLCVPQFGITPESIHQS